MGYMPSMSTNTPFFKPGEKAELARKAGITPQRLWEYLQGKSMSVKRAREMETASTLVLGYDRRIPAAAWAGFENHPAIKR